MDPFDPNRLVTNVMLLSSMHVMWGEVRVDLLRSLGAVVREAVRDALGPAGSSRAVPGERDADNREGDEEDAADDDDDDDNDATVTTVTATPNVNAAGTSGTPSQHKRAFCLLCKHGPKPRDGRQVRSGCPLYRDIYAHLGACHGVELVGNRKISALIRTSRPERFGAFLKVCHVVRCRLDVD